MLLLVFNSGEKNFNVADVLLWLYLGGSANLDRPFGILLAKGQLDAVLEDRRTH